ncbi:MAG: hypothetical protein P9L99_16705 [Candidatus Lernaella stagnicola]|nr:hypothetical protein [Candidatus Lernaella stagnicola]
MNDQTKEPRPGVIDATARVLRELLRTPKYREAMRIILREFDPENAPAFVRTVCREDPELFLAGLTATPALANALIGMCHELAVLIGQYPPQLRASLVANIGEEVNAEQLGAALGSWLSLWKKAAANTDVSQATASFAERFKNGFAKAAAADGDLTPSLLAGAATLVERLVAHLDATAEKDPVAVKEHVDRVATAIRRLPETHPKFAGEVAAPLVAAIRDALAATQTDATQKETDDGTG